MLRSVEALLYLIKTVIMLAITGTTLASVTMVMVLAKYRFFQGLGGAREELRSLWWGM